MRERLFLAISRNALLAAGVAAVMIYQASRRGMGRRPIYWIVVAVALGLTVCIASALQVRSQVERWSWTTTLGAFFVSFIGVLIVMIVAVQGALAVR